MGTESLKSDPYMSPVELRARGFDALVKSLGWVNAVRFIQQFERSSLDYSKERDAILPKWDVDDMMHRLKDVKR